MKLPDIALQIPGGTETSLLEVVSRRQATLLILLRHFG